MSIKVVAQLNPFSSERTEFKAAAPLSISEILEKIDEAHAVNTGWRVLLNDEITTDFSRCAHDGDTVYVKLVPEGDNREMGTGMKIGGGILTVLGIIIAACTSWTGIGAFIGMALIGAGVGMLAGGIVLYNMDIPSLNDREKPEQDPSIRGSRNQMRPLGCIPVLFGTRRIYADLATASYTWVDPANGSQYLYQLFCAGQKDQQIDKETIKIDETLLKDYSATGSIDSVLNGTDALLHMQIAYGGATPPLVTKCVHEIQLNSVLKHKTDEGQDGSVIRTTPADTTEIHVDVFFYNGLGQYDDKGNVTSASVALGAWYKQADEDDSAYRLLGSFSNSGNTISASELKTKRYAIHRTGLSANRWTVKISRVSADSSGSKIVDTVYVGSIRAIKDEPPVSETMCRKLTLIGLKIKASEKLNNIVEQLNFVSQAKLPAYSGQGSGASAWTMQPSNNPASAAVYAMQGDVAQQKLSDTDIDWRAFEKLYAWCTEHNYGCSAYVTEAMPISRLLSAIASTCRADIFRLNGKMTVVQDIARDGFVQLFTPRNSHSYTETLSLADIPDALSMEFVDRDSGYAENKLSVYNTPTGNKAREPDTVQELQLWGVTDSAQARKLGMYKYAVTKNRPIVHKLSCDFEYLLCIKGDWIKYAGDIALAGIAQGRIISVMYDDDGKHAVGMKTDELLPMESGKQYAVRVRKNDGTCTLIPLRTIEGSCEEVLFDMPVKPADAPHEGDLFAFGTQGNEAIDLVITDIQCGDNLSADLTCVEYAPEIFDVDSPDFILPDFKNNITDVPHPLDSGVIDLSGWQTWHTYHDGTDAPEAPVGDGTAGGWHRIATPSSVWVSNKTARTIYEGAWSAPVPTGSLALEQILGGKTTIEHPDRPEAVSATAYETEIRCTCSTKPDGLKNTVQKYVWEIRKGNATATAETTAAAYTYAFNRNTDGYPEAAELASWSVRVQAVNVYGKASEWSAPAPVGIDDYGTWRLGTPLVSADVVERTAILTFSLPERSDKRTVYGSVRYEVQIKRARHEQEKDAAGVVIDPDEITCEEDEAWYKPATSSNPKEMTEAGERAYRDGDDTGWLSSGSKYTQLLPLLGQREGCKRVETEYYYRVRARNEAGSGEPCAQVSVIALCTSLADIVYSNDYVKKQYVESLSAISANIGEVTAGQIHSNPLVGETKPNLLINLESGAEEFRVGNNPSYEDTGDERAQFMHFKWVDGVAQLSMKIANFILTSLASIINGLFYVKRKDAASVDSLFIANPNDEADEVTAVPAESVRVTGLAEVHALKVTKRPRVELELYTEYGYVVTDGGERVLVGIELYSGGDMTVEGDVTVDGTVTAKEFRAENKVTADIIVVDKELKLKNISQTKPTASGVVWNDGGVLRIS